MSVAVHGVGTSMFGKQRELSASELVWLAVDEALRDAELTEVDAVYLGTVFGAPGVAQRSLHALGLVDLPVVAVENACASGTTAYHEAYQAVQLGRYERVLAVGVEHLTSVFSGAIVPEPSDVEGRSGLALPALYALAASRYADVHGVGDEDLAQVSVKNHGHSVANPRAAHRDPVSVEEVLTSRPVADPLTLLQCASISDGAAAAVLAPATGAVGEVTIESSELRSGKAWDHRSDRVWGFDIVERTARASFEAAGVAPSDIDVWEMHDAFTIGEIVTTEAVGLAAEGEGARLLRSGQTRLGGARPVNPSGGLLSRGHPLGATGLAQIAEVCWQLRGEAGGRQVDGARLGAVETMGGGVAGIDGNACVVTVLSA